MVTVQRTRPKPAATQARPSERATEARLAVGLFLLAGGMVVVAVLGPLVFGVIDYRYSESMLNQARGLDVFAAAVVAPVAVVAGVLSLRRHPSAPLVAMGPAGFALYMLVQYVIGPEYLTVDGNSERFFPLFATLFVVAGYVIASAWASTCDTPATRQLDRRRGKMLLGFAAAIVVVMYLGNGFLSALWDFSGFVADRAATSEFDEHPTAYWIVAFLDLAVVVPLTVATGLGLIRHRRWAQRGFYGVIGWYALVPGSVASMAAVMVLRDDPAASSARALLFMCSALLFLSLAARTINAAIHR